MQAPFDPRPLVRQPAGPQRLVPQAVERIDPPGERVFHREIVPAGRPVVLRGLAADWPARRWSPEYLRREHGGTPVQAYVMRGGRVVLDAGSGFRVERMRMADYVDATLGGGGLPRLYLRASMGRLPRLAAEMSTPRYCAGRPGLRSNLWFAAPDTVSQLHFDLPHNLVAQLHGSKRFLLFERRDTRALYPCSPLSSTPHLSRVDPEAPDLARWPRLAEARPLEARLEPGDVLLIPKRVWHHARALSPSVSVNFWWCDLTTRPLLALSDAYKRLRKLEI